MEKKKFVRKQERFVLFLMLLLLFPLGALAQQKLIKGQVVDEMGEPIIGATVMVKGVTGGTITDINGNFSIQGKVGSTLSVTYVGYAPLQVKVTKQEGNRLVMKEDAKVLDEVVVVGMDTQKRNTITAAVATLKDDAIVNRPVTDVTSALQGNIAGLNFASDAVGGGVGGEIGADIKFSIRGIGSINGGEPYVLVDGVEQSMQNVNPADIASISVLKDASASAVYGARAAYGVVLVTTKSGKKERASVTYRGTVGFSAPINMPKMMNALEYAAYNNQQYDNGGASSGLQKISDKTIEKIKGFMQNPYSAEFPGIEANTTGDDWAGAYYNQYGNTDWFEYYFKDKSVRHSHNLSVQGGSDKVNYYIGMGYTYQEGLLDKVQDDLSKYNLNTKLQFKTSDWLRFNLNNNITLQMIKRPMANQMILYNKIGSHRPTQVTELPVESEYNIPSWNEMLYLKNSNYQRNRISDALSFSATVTPLEGWDITGEMKIRFDVENNNLKMKDDQKYETPAGTFKPGDATNQRQGFAYPGISWKNMYFGSYTRGSMFNYYLSPNLSSSYTHQWGDHFFKAMAGYQMELQEYSEEYMYKDGMLSNDIYSFDNASGNVIAGEARSHWATMGFYTRLNWNYNNIYFLEFSGRYDGSSRFPTDNKFGFFPSVAVGWRLSEEQFFKEAESLSFIDNLKLKASYGILGNNNIGNYPYQSTYALGKAMNYVFGGVYTQGAAVTTYVDPTLKWEKTRTTDVGIETAFWNNKLTFNAAYFYRKTTDILYKPSASYSSIFGLGLSQVNTGSLENKGWEFEIGHQNKIGEFSYHVNGNFSIIKNKVISLGVGDVEQKSGMIGNGSDLFLGYPMNMFYGYKTDGVFLTDDEVKEWHDQSKIAPNSKAGDLRYVDISGDGKVDESDKTYLGSKIPQYTFGLGLGAEYKGFDFNILLQGVAKVKGQLTNYAGYAFFQEGNIQKWQAEETWTNNQSNRYPKYPRLEVMSNAGSNNTLGSDFWILDASYLKVRNIQLGYTLPKRITQKFGSSNLRFYISLDNPFSISGYRKGWDPEINTDGSYYPILSTYTFGLTLKF